VYAVFRRSSMTARAWVSSEGAIAALIHRSPAPALES
jgi:hypothetical protein